MAHVAGTPLGTAMEPATSDDPGPDPGSDLDDHDVVVPRRDARAPLAEGKDIDVVVDPDGSPIASGESLPDRVEVPARHDRWRDGPAGFEFDRAGDPDPDPPQRSGDRLGRSQQCVKQRVDAIEAALGPRLDLGRLAVMTEDPSVQAGQRDVDARRPEVGNEDVTGVGAKPQLPRGPAARARPDVTLRDEAAIEKLANSPDHDGTAEPGPGDQLRAGPRPAESDLVQDEHQRIQGLVRQRCHPARRLDR